MALSFNNLRLHNSRMSSSLAFRREMEILIFKKQRSAGAAALF